MKLALPSCHTHSVSFANPSVHYLKYAVSTCTGDKKPHMILKEHRYLSSQNQYKIYCRRGDNCPVWWTQWAAHPASSSPLFLPNRSLPLPNFIWLATPPRVQLCA